MANREVSTVVFYDEQKRILLQDRRSISKFGEEWGFFGGSIEAGESPIETAIREIEEELEYKLTSPKFFKSYDATLPTGISAIEHLHLAKFPGYDIFNQQEGDGMRLFSIFEARQLKLLDVYYKILDDLELHLSK